MKKAAIAFGMVCAASLCGAADATWRTNPADALWNFTSLNWGAGAVWTDGDNAVFGASETKAITIEEDVAPASVSVTADGYSFDGTGVLSINGAFTVGDGLSVTVATPVAQTSGTLAQRLDKKGTGTLTLTGGGNFGRIGVTSGPLVLDGGTYNVVYPSGAEGSNGYRTPIFMFGDTSSELKVTGGATVNVSGTTIMKGTGTLRVENGTVDASGVDMWNCAYTDVTTGKTIIGDGGKLIVNGWLNSGFSSASQTNNVTTLVTTGGVLELKAGLVGNSSSFYSCMLFDHGTLRTTANNFSTYKNKTVIKAGPGGLYLDVPQNMTSVDGFLSDGGEQDGGLHPRGAPVLYMGGSNYHRGGTWLDDVDSNMFCIRSEEALGRVPDAPTSNIFFTTSNNILLTDRTITVHSNRTICVSEGVTAQFGVASATSFTIGSQIVGPTNSYVQTVSNWTGNRRIVFDPGEGRTNSFGRLALYLDAVINSGVTMLTKQYSSADPHNNNLHVGGSGSSLTINGGELHVNHDSTYATTKGNLYVYGGLADFDTKNELLHAFSASATTVVARAGTLTCKTFRIAQSSFGRVYLATGGVMRINGFGIDVNASPRGQLDFDGGLLVARTSNQSFTGGSAQWLESINAYVLAGGLIVSNDNQVFFKLPLQSAAEHDGGVQKWGAGEFALVGENTFNGPVVIHQGSFILGRHDTTLPETAVVNVRSHGTFSANGQRQVIARLEGGGRIDHRSAVLTVNGTVAPHGDDPDDPVGTITFASASTLAGDLEIGGNTNGCGCVKFNVAGMDIANLALKVPDVSAFDKEKDTHFYKVVDAPNGYSGRFASVALPPPWQVKYADTGVYVYFPKGTVLICR